MMMDVTNNHLPAVKGIDSFIESGRQIMWTMVQYKELQMTYNCALKEIKTKFEILDSEFDLKYKRNPISSIHTRLKGTQSVMKKLAKYHLPVTLDSIEKGINDFAGIRVICSYIDDIYSIAEAFLAQDDVTLVDKKDYIKCPKQNGYRSLHLIVSIPVFFADAKKHVKAEVQIRTVAMDFWASLEHQLHYKEGEALSEELWLRLKACAETIHETDTEMLEIRKRMESMKDKPSEEELLLERFAKIDMPIL